MQLIHSSICANLTTDVPVIRSWVRGRGDSAVTVSEVRHVRYTSHLITLLQNLQMTQMTSCSLRLIVGLFHFVTPDSEHREQFWRAGGQKIATCAPRHGLVTSKAARSRTLSAGEGLVGLRPHFSAESTEETFITGTNMLTDTSISKILAGHSSVFREIFPFSFFSHFDLMKPI